MSSRRGNWVAVATLGAAATIGAWLGVRGSDDSSITFLSVGQGDCTVIQSDGATVLVDAGPATMRKDAGAKIVVPKLRALGVTQVDLVVLTHPDSDHIGGTGAILKAYPGARIAISQCFESNRELNDDFERWHIDPKSVWWLGERQRIRTGGFAIDILCPDNPPNGKTNDGSAFIHLVSANASAVLTGDAPIEVENAMIGRLDWRSQIMKAGHHGSRTASGEAWIRAVQPEVAIVSCGRDNEYGHPHRAVLDRFAAAGVPVLRTDEVGDIRYVVRNGRFQIVRNEPER